MRGSRLLYVISSFCEEITNTSPQGGEQLMYGQLVSALWASSGCWVHAFDFKYVYCILKACMCTFSRWLSTGADNYTRLFTERHADFLDVLNAFPSCKPPLERLIGMWT